MHACAYLCTKMYFVYTYACIYVYKSVCGCVPVMTKFGHKNTDKKRLYFPERSIVQNKVRRCSNAVYRMEQKTT
jgi:hypothetical protein